MSSGLSTSSMPTMEDTATAPSLMLSAAMCEWQSMMPGITNWPPASITRAPSGTSTFSLASRILPSRIRMDPWKVPLVTVSTVALRMTVVCPAPSSDAGSRASRKRAQRIIGHLPARSALLDPQAAASPEWARTSRARRGAPFSIPRRRRLRNGLVLHAIDEHILDLGLLIEQAAFHHQQIGDLAWLDGPYPVGHTVDFSGAEGQRAHRGGFGQARVNRAFQRLPHILGSRTAGVECEARAGFFESGGGGGRAIAQFQRAEAILLVRVGVFGLLGPLQVDQQRNPGFCHAIRDLVRLVAAVQHGRALQLRREENHGGEGR